MSTNPYEAPNSIPDQGPRPLSKWRRLGNFAIDYLLVLAVFVAVLVFVETVWLGIRREHYIRTREMPDFPPHYDKNLSATLAALVTSVLSFFYFFVLESWFGKTLGKFVTRTVVVNRLNNTPSRRELFWRTLLRFIPWDCFTFLTKSGWHDKYSATKVVRYHRKNAR